MTTQTTTETKTETKAPVIHRLLFKKEEVKVIKSILKRVDKTRQALDGVIVKDGAFIVTDGKVLFRVKDAQRQPAGMINGLYDLLKAEKAGAFMELTLVLREGLTPPNTDQVINDAFNPDTIFDANLHESSEVITALCLMCFKRLNTVFNYELLEIFAPLNERFTASLCGITAGRSPLKLTANEWTALIMPLELKTPL
jgi:hypothetical protein